MNDILSEALFFLRLIWLVL